MVGILHGTLPAESYRHYASQDYYYLGCFREGYNKALQLLDSEADPHAHAVLSMLLSGVEDELAHHSEYCKKWGADPQPASPTSATLAYTEFLASVSEKGSVQKILVSMLPCMRLYAWLATQMALSRAAQGGEGKGEGEGPFETWIRTYSGEEYSSLASEQEVVVDRMCAGEDYGSLLGLYR